ncbi:MAG: VCBS repeat-containing protein [candidate division Zixibacteria bacterium]|nr:VCBS repeat-containing protein [candidate division Zixibacteria bacterium]
MRKSLTVFSFLFIFILLVFNNASADMTVELIGGSLNGVPVDGGVLEMTVTPGADITGTVSIRTANSSPSNNIAPLVLVWNWDTHQSAFATIDGWIPTGVTNYDVPISLTVPDTSGLYFITFAFGLEKTGAQVASLTNWQVDGGAAHWNDGMDIADWAESEYDQSVTDHFVTTPYELVGGIFDRDVPAAMVNIYAELPPQIVSFSPVQNELDVQGSTNIIVTFDENIDETTLNAGNFIVNGSCSGQHMGVISYDAGTRTVTMDPWEDFGCGELVTVLLTRGIEATGGTAMVLSFSWSFTVAVEDNGGDFISDSAYAVGSEPYGVYSADMDNDGDVDIVSLDLRDVLTVLFNDGNGVFTVDTVQEASYRTSHVTVADLNGDLLPDIASSASDSSRIEIHFNAGGGNFAPVVRYSVGASPYGICAADLNGDGHIDLATSNYSGNNVSVLINHGNGTFPVHMEYAAGTGTHGISYGDLDNDGDLDLVTGCWSNPYVYVSLNNGNGTFLNGVGYDADYYPRCPITADFDDDGNLDIAVSNFSGQSISVLPGNGDGTFGIQSAVDVAYPYNVCKGDIDGDGDIDLVAPEYSDGWIKILTNDGLGDFTTADSVATSPSGPFNVCAADYNGDGILDIASTNIAGHLQIILNQMVTAVEDSPLGLPSQFNLRQNYPNPFNPETIIEYRLQKRTQVKLTVYNVLGQPVKTLVDEMQSAGNYRAFWNGTDQNNRSVATGVYFYRLRAGDFTEAKKMVLLK